jgi:hypothetical protein
MWRSWTEALISTSFYFESCIRPDSISRCIRQRNSTECCTDLRNVEAEILAVMWQEWTVHGSSKLSPRPKETRQVKIKVKSMLIIFFDIKGIVHKRTSYRVILRRASRQLYVLYISMQNKCVLIIFPPQFTSWWLPHTHYMSLHMFVGSEKAFPEFLSLQASVSVHSV